jgi:hypothetical protein
MNDTSSFAPERRRSLWRPRLDADWGTALRSPLVIALAIALGVQLALSLWWDQGNGMAPAQADAPLLSVDPAAVTELAITAADGGGVLIRRQGQDWVLPDLGDFPASSTRVDQLLDNLAALTRPLPVANSPEAQRRFNVAEDAFERRLTLRAGDGEATLIVGDSPGFRRLFARLHGEDAVYDLRLALFDLSADADDWIDRSQLQFDRGEIDRIRVKDADDTWALVRGEEGWSLEGSDAEIDHNAADMLANAIATVSYTGVLGPDTDATYALDDPARIIDIEHDGQQRRYLIAPIADSDDYVLTRDGTDIVYRLAGFDAQALLDTGRAELLGEEKPSAEVSAADAAGNEPAAAVVVDGEDPGRQAASARSEATDNPAGPAGGAAGPEEAAAADDAGVQQESAVPADVTPPGEPAGSAAFPVPEPGPGSQDSSVSAPPAEPKAPAADRRGAAEVPEPAASALPAEGSGISDAAIEQAQPVDPDASAREPNAAAEHSEGDARSASPAVSEDSEPVAERP